MNRLKFSLAAATAVTAAAMPAAANDRSTMLQYFEASWSTMRYRMADVFMAGYDSMWTPPPQKGQSGSSDIGYALFDRFDLGSSGSPTRYGDETQFRLMVDEAHRAGVRVYVDWIMNHNGTWDNSTPNFITQGGYPGFVLTAGGDPWGDFHTPGTQSENPGGAGYNLYEGRLLGLIDIAQEKNILYIRHPATPGDPQNIPAGTIWNKVDANNRRFYPDQGLGGTMVNNPGTSRNPGSFNYTFFPYNQADPLQGDPVVENATSLLLRSSQYYLEVLKVDGFRLDAAKHIPTWFWDNLWDSIVYQRYRDFDGVVKTPYSFSEAVESNNNMSNWVRKPGEPGSGVGWPAQGWQHGNRDALDLNEAGQLRDLVNNDGSGSWDNVMGNSVDNVDGFNNGTIGVHHVNSHDNAIADGENDSVAQAYVLMRTGPSIVYYMALQFGNPPNNFPKRNGRDDAIGLGSDAITRLVNLRNEYARGWFIPITTGGQQGDVLVFTRRTPNSVDNVMIGVNDSEANGWDTRNLTTTFPQGTRLHELTGNATDGTVDPTNQIHDLITVGAGGSVSVNVPRNRNTNGTFHGRGYVIYGPAVPTGTLSIANASTSVVGPDAGGVADYIQRVTPITVVTSPTFDIQLQTVQTDPSDPNTDDLAVFRIDSGFKDYNGNGSTYLGSPSSDNNPGNTSEQSPSYGFENFLTQSSPRWTGGSGTYRQTIDAAALGEGYHYITVRAYRHRDSGDPLFGEFRMVIYVDLENPEVELVSPSTTCSNDITALPVVITTKAIDLTVDRVHIFVDLPPTTDFIFLANLGANQATQSYTTFTRTISSMASGNHRIDVVSFESFTNKINHQTFTGINAITPLGAGLGDATQNGTIDADDIRTFTQRLFGPSPNYCPPCDFDCDGEITTADVPGFVDALLNN